jgi:hypothetical protein
VGARSRLRPARISVKGGLGKASLSGLRRGLRQAVASTVGFGLVLIGNGECAALASASSSPAHSRVFTLYPEEDLVFSAPSLPNGRRDGAMTVSRTTLALGEGRCAALLSHFPLAYLTLQAGASCAVQTGLRNALAVEILLEGAYRASANTKSVRPGGLVLLRHTFDLLEPGDTRLRTTASLSYKFVPRESDDSQEEYAQPKYNPFYTQRWADVLESRVAFGILLSTPWRGALDGFAAHAQYLETLPLALRRVGGLADSASVQYKQLTVDARTRVATFSFGDLFLGGGLGYAVLTFDGIRAGLPLPSLAAGLLW